MLHKRIKRQLVIFAVIAVVGVTVFATRYVQIVALFGGGTYKVTVQLPRSNGLYATGNVSYRGVEVGQVSDVHVSGTGVEAVLALRTGVSIPSDLDAEVHSLSAAGEQYVMLLPRSADARPLRNGDVIPMSRTTVPPYIGSLLDAANRGLQAIPPDNLKTVVDESYEAFGGLGLELRRLVTSGTQLSIDARKNLDPIIALIDKSQPILNSQADTADAIQAWAAHLATITHQLESNDTAVSGLLRNGGPAADEARQLIDRLAPTLPVLMANLVSVNEVALVYHPALEQALVLVPPLITMGQAFSSVDKNTKHPGIFLDFKLNLNAPPPCTTGFLPARQARDATLEDTPERPTSDLYCRVPQDAPVAVRGARNTPCVTHPGKRAPTAKMCETDEEYVPLNDGWNWKGDPNATLSGQDVPQPRPGSPQQAPPIPVAEYDPATGTYVGPDGRAYTQADLADNAKGKTWQSMLTPPGN